jgi:hypothetical protein
MSFTLLYVDRLAYLSTSISPGVRDLITAYTRCFDERRVVDARGRIVPGLSPRLRRAEVRLLQACSAFERAAAADLAAINIKEGETA